jgi:hypothetical protein
VGRIESAVVGAFIAIIVPACMFFAAWWLSVALVPERAVPACALGGLGLGAVLDAFFLARWTARAYEIRVYMPMLLYIFVSVITYALCMGVPVFILVPGAVAGVYAGRRFVHARANGERAAMGIRRAGLFTAVVIACASAVSAFLVLHDTFAGADLAHMFRLKSAITRPMIAVFVAIGGPALVACQYWLTTKAARIAYGVNTDADTNHR